MTFDEFVAEWRKQVRQYGGGVPQEAIDMAEQAWEIATASEREACAKLCDEVAEMVTYQTDSQGAAEKCANAIRARSNPEVTGHPPEA